MAISEPTMATKETRLRVWDLPVRLCHWSFALLVPAMWYTADNSLWYWHTRLGIVLLAVLIFRIIWGVIGTRTARFAQFVKGPRAVLQYLRGSGEGAPYFGHSPIGALATITLLTAMFAQVSMGLFAGDPFDGATGPLNHFVGVLTADQPTDWHAQFVCVLLGLVALHLSAIAFYAVARRINLIAPMINGKRAGAAGCESNDRASWGKALIAALIAAGLALWVWNGAPPLG